MRDKIRDKIRELVEVDDIDYPIVETILKVNSVNNLELYAEGEIAYSLRSSHDCLYFHTNKDIDDQIDDQIDHFLENTTIL